MKTAVVTGATSGIGFAVTRTLSEQGWAGIGYRPFGRTL